MKAKRALLIALALLLAAAGFRAEAAGHRIGDNELRGVWIASVWNLDFPSRAGLSAAEQRAELDDIVRIAGEAGLNAIFFQVRPTADALYASGIFPTSQWLTGSQGAPLADGFDPLAYLVEAAHAAGIEVHAWINPYRITQGSPESPRHDLGALAPEHPARLNPDWVVAHGDGRLYFDPGLPEVRDLVVRGVLELVQNYNIDGIHFDDYFYPYPSPDGADFDDAATFERLGGGMELGDWRRNNVNMLVRETHAAIKRANPDVRFGVSPSGVWANADKNPAGSDTQAWLQSRYLLHADARAWVEGGYVDYIIPQIYWEFSHALAPYDILVRWWSALVDGTGVDLYIGHAAYKLQSLPVPGFQSELEIPRQIEYARQFMGVRGHVFYGFADIRANAYRVKDNLAELFAEPRYVPRPADNGGGIIINRPASNAAVDTAGVNIMGGSNPAFPVYFDGRRVPRTRSGFFAVYAQLAPGRNELAFTHNSARTVHAVTRGERIISPAAHSYPQMRGYGLELLSPRADVVVRPGSRVQVRVLSPSGSAVTARLGGAFIRLEPLTNPPDEGEFMAEVYSGTFTMPGNSPGGAIISLGEIRFTAVRGAETAELAGVRVKLADECIYGATVEVTRDFTSLRASPESSWVRDYLPAAVGMRDRVTGFESGHFRLGFGGYVAAADVMALPGRELAPNRISSAEIIDAGGATEIRFGAAENVPVTARVRDGIFSLTLFNTRGGGVPVSIGGNPMFTSASFSYTEDSVTYILELAHPDNFYGFEVAYEAGHIIIRVRNPMAARGGARPLEGLRIAVDAGHGGADPGALGFVPGRNEADLALDTALALRDILTGKGAEVIMTREDDTASTIAERVFLMNDARVDLGVSVHYNSMSDAQDNARIRGVLPLFSNESGRLLSRTVGRALGAELNRNVRDMRFMELGVARSHKFPMAFMEIAFMTNPAEFEFAQSAEGARRTAQGIADGIVAWIDAQAQFAR